MTVLENLMVAPLGQRGDSPWAALLGPRVWMREERRYLESAWALLERFGLAPLAQEYAGNLSGGQKRLLELARALHMKPRLLLLDEPMAGVNPALIAQLGDYIAGLNGGGAIFNDSGSLGVRNCTFYANAAVGGLGGSGGAIYNTTSSGGRADASWPVDS